MKVLYLIKRCSQLKSSVPRTAWLMLCGMLLSASAVYPARAGDIAGFQQIVVSGTVTDAAGWLPGVSVVIKGTTTGTITDSEGKFSITVPDADAVLLFSFIGYITQEVIVGVQRRIEIEMIVDSQTIEEVVITGYGGTVQRSKLTNSISTVKEETFKIGAYSHPARALSGSVSGLRVVQSSGNPISAPVITLRGGTNFDSSGSPLIIIDGQIRSMHDINPDDIESMEVLKDAGATAIYGARANNGVVLITTKSGKHERNEINVNVKVGLNYLNYPYSFLNAGDYLYWMRNAYKNAAQIYQNSAGDWVGSTNMSTLAGVAPYGTGNLYWNPANPSVPLDGNMDTRAVWSPMILDATNRFLLYEGWQTMTDPIYGDEIIYKEFDMAKAAFNNPSVTQDYSVSFSGGNQKGRYYASFGYHNAQSLPIETFYQRMTGAFNADYQIKSWLTSYTNIGYTNHHWTIAAHSNEANYFARMVSTPPTMRGQNADGELLLGRDWSDGNPQVNINSWDNYNDNKVFSLGQSFKFDLMKGLFIKTSVSYAYNDLFSEYFNKDYLQSPGVVNTTRRTNANTNRTLRQTYLATINYNTTIAVDHNVSALAGIEYFDSYNWGIFAEGSGAPTDDFRDLALTSTDESMRDIDSWRTRERILSFMGRVNYDYRDKYLLSATFRRDGYSRLLDNRWGFFPGVSAGWIISREEFMYGLNPVISFAKIRSSYGVNGNVSGVGEYELQGSFGLTTRYNGGLAYGLTAIPNPSLRWERTKTFEIGADLGFLANLLNLSVVWYNRITDDKYANIILPASSGVTSIRSNNGVLRNRGLELEAGVRLLRNTKDWKWDINGNISYNINTVINLPDNGLERNRQGAFQVYDPKTKELIWVGGLQEGQRPGDIYAHIAQGIFKTEDEVRQIAANRIDRTTLTWGGNDRLYGPDEWNKLSDAEKANGYPIQPGDVIWKDVNGDGEIDNFDMEYIGNTIPKWIGGLTNATSWKGFSLLVRVDYALGHYQIDDIRPWFMGCVQGTFNTITETKNTWTPDNINAEYPKYYWADQLGKRNYVRRSSMFTYDASYLCLREVALSYNLPQDMVKKVGMTGVQFSVVAGNLGYITKSKLFSPETGGTIGGGYSLPRTFVFATSITF